MPHPYPTALLSKRATEDLLMKQQRLVNRVEFRTCEKYSEKRERREMARRLAFADMSFVLELRATTSEGSARQF